MKLFGLKDENGKEYVLEADLRSCFHNVINVMPIEPTPKFKVGGWIISNEYPQYGVVRINEIFGNILYFTGYLSNGDEFHSEIKAQFVRLATSEEIEKHLIALAEKKGFIKGRKFKSIFSDEGAERKLEYFNFNQKEFKWRYIDSMDALYCDNGMATYGRFCSNPFIYRNGQWCPIIPVVTDIVNQFRNFLTITKIS